MRAGANDLPSIGGGHEPRRSVDGRFLFTDIEGSTGLWDEHRTVMEVALARRDLLVPGAVADGGGVVFSTGGDGLAAAFGRASDAVGAAVAAQILLQQAVWPESVELKVRMGLHTGEAQERDGDYFGPSVSRAARLMAVAYGGQIVMSSATADMVEGRLTDG